jgi:alginate biosynthesis protein AlgX
MIGRLFAVAMAGLLVMPGLPAAAQSDFGCINLAGRHSLPSVEGADGIFYRVDPDLHMFHAFSDETVGQIADLAAALAALGTTLIYVPVPTKSLAMPDQLPVAATDLGFDLSIATTVFDEMLRKLDKAGVASTNLRTALRTAPEAPPSFYGTDYRMTAEGARRMATALANLIAATEGFADIPKGAFETRAAGPVIIDSDMRNILQRHCTSPLPLAQTESYATNRFQTAQASGDTAIFGSPAGSARIAVVGTEYTGGTVANLSGFLAEATGLDVLEYTVDGGGAFAAISSYLTSRQFQDSRPAYLIWANPVFENLAQYGDLPMRELIAAAGGNCRVTLPLATGFEQNTLSADLRALQPGQSYTLFVDADGAQATEARFTFVGPNGEARTRKIIRNPDQVPTGRFYMAMAGLFSGPPQTAQITLDVPFGINARVTACYD